VFGEFTALVEVELAFALSLILIKRSLLEFLLTKVLFGFFSGSFSFLFNSTSIFPN